MFRRTLFIAAFALVLICAAFAAHAAVWYVDGTKNGNGTSWAQAFQTIQQGITAASSGDEVWVRGSGGGFNGVYAETITLKNGVAVYGGFNGDETDWEDRDYETHTTTIDADEDDTAVYAEGLTSPSTLDGFTITDGEGKISGDSTFGGGIYCSGCDRDFVICNNTFEANIADYGVHIYMTGSAPKVLRNDFIHGW